MNINSLILGFGLFRQKKLNLRIQLHFASLARYVCHPKVHQSGLNQWSGGGLTGSTINQVGKQDWFQPDFEKTTFEAIALSLDCMYSLFRKKMEL